MPSELFSDLRTHAAALLVNKGVSPEVADSSALELAVELSRSWGGQIVYIPRHDYIEQRRGLILREYEEGASVRELAFKYRISRQWIYRLVRNDPAPDSPG
jgi:Mor family transcriptional regulator